MSELIAVAKGNRLQDVEAMVKGKCAVIGYTLYTGPDGEETADTSYCGTRLAKYLIADHPGLRKFKKFAIECPGHKDWDCWQLAKESPDTSPMEACHVEPERVG